MAAVQDLARRVAQLESQVVQLQAEVRSVHEKPSWQRSLERFAGDEELLSVFADAMKLREAERTKTRTGARTRRP